jgi:hypothetical protein
VKRCSGEDTWRVASWENSSVPGHYFTKKLSLTNERAFWLLFGFIVIFAFFDRLKLRREKGLRRVTKIDR